MLLSVALKKKYFSNAKNAKIFFLKSKKILNKNFALHNIGLKNRELKKEQKDYINFTFLQLEYPYSSRPIFFLFAMKKHTTIEFYLEN